MNTINQSIHLINIFFMLIKRHVSDVFSVKGEMSTKQNLLTKKGMHAAAMPSIYDPNKGRSNANESFVL